MTELTQERLKELLHYDPEDGIFTRIVGAGSKKSGAVVGGKNSDGYLRARIDNKERVLHRLAWLYMYGEFPKGQIDHINHIRDDNRISNLRDVCNMENHRNRAASVFNTSGFTGVYLNNKGDKFVSRIRVGGKLLNLGCFDNITDAIEARKSANIKHGFHENHGANNAQD